MPTITVSGTIRVSWGSSIATSIPFSAMYTASVALVHSLQLSNGVSDAVVSLGTLSSPGFVMLTADQLCRVNYGAESSVSGGSAGRGFYGVFAQVGSGMSGPLALHFANSSGNLASITMVQGM